jgi:hypothetical protein
MQLPTLATHETLRNILLEDITVQSRVDVGLI